MELMEMLSEQSQNLVLMLTFFFCIITLVQQRQTQIELREIKLQNREIKLQTQIDLREIKLQTQIGFKEIREGVPLREFLVQSPCCLVTSPKHVPLLK
jgi:hypothetical protein